MKMPFTDVVRILHTKDCKPLKYASLIRLLIKTIYVDVTRGDALKGRGAPDPPNFSPSSVIYVVFVYTFLDIYVFDPPPPGRKRQASPLDVTVLLDEI
uniref:Uncharacterized protein n=1 Tax=Helianthus annuus TaxID=4232 RepID=A0A251V3F6_HELAN